MIRHTESPNDTEDTMRQTIKTITLPLPYRLGSMNCYLVRTDTGFLLIDTGATNSRAMLENELARAGCRPGNLQLIVLTHGDFDHTGNAAYLRETLGAQIAMHQDDVGMAERGDMFSNRSSGNRLMGILAPILFRFPRSNHFAPEFTLAEGDDLSAYGFDAQVLSLPGHSKGSIGILTAGGDLFCGDLLANEDQPALNAIMDDTAAACASIEKLKDLELATVYPGHGKPFPMDLFLASYRPNDRQEKR
jgi:glyoxylase-like metal-dependent hydrolase (beta-lactamase superfamily II)